MNTLANHSKTNHVFWIHSHITYYISKKIILDNQIKSPQIIFIVCRNYTNNDTVFNTSKKINFDNSKQMFSLRNPLRNPLRIFRNHIYTHKKLNFIFESNFVLYTPHTGYHSQVPYLIKNKKCLHFNYIEEGFLSYIKNYFVMDNKLSFWGSEKFKTKALNLHLKKFSNSYSISEKAFLSNKKNIVLKDVFQNFSTEQSIENIIVFDALVSFKIISKENSLILLEKHIIKHLINNNQKVIHYKFHIEQYNPKNIQEQKDIKNIFNKYPKLKFIELKPEIFLEGLIHNNLCNVYIYISSVSVYASLMGANVFSISNRLKPQKKIILNSDLIKNWKQI